MSHKSRVLLAPLALTAFVSAAFADESSVTLYGTLDEAIANVSHSLSFNDSFPVATNTTLSSNKGTQSATGILNGGLSATKFGLKGEEDMGGGLKGVFLLEQGFNLPTGSISNAALALATNKSTGPSVAVDSAVSGQMFNRGAFVGLASSSWGTLTAGRQQSFFLDNIAIFDPMLGSQAFSPLGFSGSYGGGGFTDDSRTDNSLKYRIALSDFNLGASYKFGGVAGSGSAQTAYEVNGVYASGPFAVQLGYQAFKDAFSLSTAAGTGTIAATAGDTDAYMVSAKYTYEKTTVRLGYELEQIKNPSNPTQDQQVTAIFGYPLSAPATVNKYTSTEDLKVYWIGGTQEITSAFAVSLGVYHVAQNSFIAAGAACTGTQSQCAGATNYYSLMADYNLSKRTDVYLGIMDVMASGGPANADKNTAPTPSENTNRTVALGWRHRF